MKKILALILFSVIILAGLNSGVKAGKSLNENKEVLPITPEFNPASIITLNKINARIFFII